MYAHCLQCIRGLGAIANGAATAANWMSAASLISMAGLISFLGYDDSISLMSWTGGYVLLALLLPPTCGNLASIPCLIVWAIAGMIGGLIFTTFYITGVTFYGMPTWFFDVSAEGISTVGIVINFIVTLVVSRLPPPPLAEIQHMVNDLRDPPMCRALSLSIGEKQRD